MTDAHASRLSSLNELLGKAVGILATGKGPIHERLADAGAYELIHAKRYADELPPDEEALFRDVWSRMTCAEPTGGEGSIAASVNELTVEEAQSIARTVLELAAIAEELASD